MSFFKKIKKVIDAVEDIASDANKIYDSVADGNLSQKQPVQQNNSRQPTPATATLPEADVEDPILEEDFIQAAQKNLPQDYTAKKAIITSRKWVEKITHGNIISHERIAAIVSQDAVGNHYLEHLIFKQDYKDGFGQTYISEAYGRKPLDSSLLS